MSQCLAFQNFTSDNFFSREVFKLNIFFAGQKRRTNTYTAVYETTSTKPNPKPKVTRLHHLHF
jgi:hypothetical protein